MKAGIAGAGIMGRLLAFALIRSGWQVTLFDQHDLRNTKNCSMSAAGLLTPIAELDRSELLIYQLGSAAIKNHWPDILDLLQDNIYFRQSGSIVVSHPRDHAEVHHFLQRINSKLTSSYQQIDIQTLEPEITNNSNAYYFPDEAHIDSQAVFHALGDYLISQQIIWLNNSVVSSVRPGKIEDQHKIHLFDISFDCRGLGAKQIFSDIRGVRGELIWLHAPLVKINRPIRLLHPRYNLYIVPRPNQIYIIGASEIEAEDMNPISVKTTLELLTAAYYLHPGLAEARIVDTVTQLRPTLANHLPQIKYHPEMLAINGLYRHGYLIAPALVNEILLYLNHGIANVQHQQIWERLYD